MHDCIWCFNEVCIREDCPYFDEECPVMRHPDICLYYNDEEENHEFADNEI